MASKRCIRGSGINSMRRIEPFDKYALRHEEWFVKNKFAYESELRAVRMMLPDGDGIEVGLGSGRFAAPLGVEFGIDPSIEMMRIAKKRRIKAVCGIAEALPFRSLLFNFVLMVTTICFLDDVEVALKEAFRVLKSGSNLIIGFIDRDSPVGRFYQKHKEKSVFYRVANFYTVDEVITHLTNIGFSSFSFVQTIFSALPEITTIEPVKEGYGDGSFIVVKATK